MRKYIIIILLIVSGCTSNMYEIDTIVVGISSGASYSGKYKYYYEINAFPANQGYFSNQEFKVGDTLYFKK